MTETQVTRDEFEALAEKVESIEAENEQLREENDELHDRVDELEAENDELHDRVDELEAQADHAAGNAKGAHERLNDLKERLSELDTPTPEAGETTVQQHETPLEQVAAMPDFVADDQLTANQQRARFVAMNLSDYATKVGSGDYALTAGDLRTVLTAAFDQSHSETVNRVRTILADLGGDDVEIHEPTTAAFKNTAEKKAKGKKLIVSSSLVRRLEQIDHDVVTGAEA